MKLIILLFTVGITLGAFADDGPTWYKGSLVLKTRQVLKGELSVETNHNVVLFKIGDEIIVYPAHKVQSLYYYDVEEEVNRKFIALERTLGAYTIHALYEVVVFGEVSVLRRPRVLPYSIHYEVIDYEYFTWQGDGDLLPIRKFKRSVYPTLLSIGPDKMRRFVRENKLSLGRTPHAIRIVEFYNEQSTLQNTIAKH